MSNSGVKSPQVTYIKNIKNIQSDEKILKVTQSDENLPETSELEINELEELNKFI